MTGRTVAWPSVPTLGLRRRWAFVSWGLWLSIVTLCTAVAVATFARFLGSGSEPLVVGPLAMNPALSDELVRLFGSDGPMRLGQSLVHVAGFVIYTSTGLFIVARRPSTWMPLLGSAMLVLVGTSLFAPLATLEGTDWEEAAHLIGTLSPEAIGSYWTSLAGLSVGAFFLVFPDRRWVPGWTVWAFVGLALVGAVSLMAPDVSPSAWKVPAGLLWGVAVPFGLIAAQVYRQAVDPGDGSRRARPIVLSFGFVIAAFTMIWVVSPKLSPDTFGLILATPRLVAVYDVNLLILLTVAVFVFPISIWVGIARYRLFDIDLIVNRALVYGTITVLVGVGVLAVFAAIALVLGVPAGSTLSPGEAAFAGVATGAVFTAAFRPLRMRVQRGVDRRFYREKYEVDRAIEVFAARAEEVVEIEELVGRAFGHRGRVPPRPARRVAAGRLNGGAGARRRGSAAAAWRNRPHRSRRHRSPARSPRAGVPGCRALRVATPARRRRPHRQPQWRTVRRPRSGTARSPGKPGGTRIPAR